jgi:putrescine transport system permease protein
VALVRFRRFKGRTLFSGMVSAPLVMPDVITGPVAALALRRHGKPARLAARARHADHRYRPFHLLHGLCLRRGAVAPVRFRSKASRKPPWIWAPRPLAHLFRHHPAHHRSALVSGWLLGFTLSLDDLVIASFVSGPGSSTLPMVIFSKVRLGVSPDVNALATIIIGIVALGVLAATIIQLRSRPKKARA